MHVARVLQGRNPEGQVKMPEELQGEYGRPTELVHVAMTSYGTGALPEPRVDIGSDGAVVDVFFSSNTARLRSDSLGLASEADR